jgi:hypothetical protein
MKTNYFFEKKVSIYSTIVFLICLTSCGSYQNTSYYDNDGIYGNTKIENRTGQTTENSKNSDYQEYFSNLNNNSKSFIDVDNYSSISNDSINKTETYIPNNSGWGNNPQNITINVYDSNWGAGSWNNYWYGNHWGMNNWQSPWGWNSWYGNGFNNGWGWNMGWGWNNWYGPGFGWGWNNGWGCNNWNGNYANNYHYSGGRRQTSFNNYFSGNGSRNSFTNSRNNYNGNGTRNNSASETVINYNNSQSIRGNSNNSQPIRNTVTNNTQPIRNNNVNNNAQPIRNNSNESSNIINNSSNYNTRSNSSFSGGNEGGGRSSGGGRR